MDYRELVLGLILLFSIAFVFAAPWDFLRPVVNLMASIEVVTAWLFLLVSLLVLIIGLVAFKKKYSRRLIWVNLAFGLFSFKALLVVFDLYVSPGNFMNYSIQSFFDLLVIGCLFVALFRN